MKITITFLCCLLTSLAVGQRIKDFPEKLSLSDTNNFEVVESGLTNLGSRRVSFGTLATNVAARLGVPVPPSSSGTWLIDDEFLGDFVTRSLGRDAWLLQSSGGGILQDAATNFTGSLGLKQLIVTNAADRSGMNLNANLNGLTNAEYFFSARVAIGTLDFAGATNEMTVGLSDSTTQPGPNGIYFLSRSNQWLGVVSRNGLYNLTDPLSNCVANSFVTLAFYLNATGTNVDFYIGGANGALVWKTNVTSKIPNIPGILIGAQAISRKLTGATERMTNYIDNFKLWARRL